MQNMTIDPKAIEALKSYIPPTDFVFGKYNLPIMVESDYENGKWSPFKLIPWGPISLLPNAKVFHYGQEIFEGMKAYKSLDGKVSMFRPDKNAERFNRSAVRMAMPEVPVEDFIYACKVVTAYSAPFIPTADGCSLYMRPFMIATTEELKINPSEKFKFLVIASPSGQYFRGEASVRLLIERHGTRAAPGGMGFAKTGGNYAQSLQAQMHMKDKGFDQIIWLDAVHKKYIEELSGMNFFAVINGELVTPALTDTILDGVTRDSILQIARHLGISVKEMKIDINEFCKQIEREEATEAFACGTAAIIAPARSITDTDGKEYHFKYPKGNVGMELRRQLLGMQTRAIECPYPNWIVDVPESTLIK